jgi:hypothetical protein
MKRLPGTLLSLALAGCIFNSDKSGTRFDVSLDGDLHTVYAYEADGSRGAALGLGVSVEKPTDDDWIFFDFQDSALVFWTDSGSSRHLLRITQDSTFILTAEMHANPPFPTISTETRAAYAGAPCTFTRLRGFQPDSNDEYPYYTVPLVISEARLTRAGSTLRFDLVIDTAASRAADARVDFSEDEFYGTMRVSCP